MFLLHVTVMPTSCEYTSLNSKTLLLYFTTLSALLHVTVLRYNIVARHLWTCNILSARHFNQVYYCGTSFLHVSYLIIPHCTWLAFHYTAIKVNLFIDTRHALLLNFCVIHGEDQRFSSSWVTESDYRKRYAHPESETSEAEGGEEEYTLTNQG